MEVNSSCASPKEEGELEDGEIFDDEPQTQRQQYVRPPRRTRTSRGMMNKRARLPGPMVNNSAPVPPRAHLPGPMIPTAPHPAFPHGLRPLTGPGQAVPRSGFWERSHGALGRFRYRSHHASDWTRGWPERFAENHSGRTESPCRKQKAGGRCVVKWTVPPKAQTVDESFEDLLLKYKQIQVELECIHKEERMALKDEDTADQRLAGTDNDPLAVTVLEPISAVTEQKKIFQAFNIKPLRQKLLSPAERDVLNSKSTQSYQRQDNEEMEKDPSQDDDVKDEESESDLNITTVSEETTAAHGQRDPPSPQVPSSTSPTCWTVDAGFHLPPHHPNRVPSPQACLGFHLEPVKEEEDDVSELQLRLLALQSASRKWQQKEQQVLKESREKITKAAKVSQDKSSSPCDRNKMNSRANAAVCRSQDRARPAAKPASDKTKPVARAKKPAHMTKQAWRKQRLRTWKLQHQQEQVEQRHKQEEEEERKKREDEIRKIRDLSNQDEQYNRFMKLVGSKCRSNSKSSDTDQRKLLKQSLDTSGNLYQYDNYDEVAMDTDSETNSPATSPTHDALFPLESTPLRQVLRQQVEFVLSAPPPPLPPLPPPDETELPPKPPFADEEEEEEMLLREELLKSLANKRAVKAEDTSSSSGPPSPALRPAVQSNTRNNLAAVSLNSVISHPRALKFVRGHSAPNAPFVLPRHKTVVVCLNASDDSDSDGESCSTSQIVFGGLESMIKEARRTVEAAKPKHSLSEKENNPVKSAEALPDAKMEYRRLREDMGSVEKQRLMVASSPVGSDSELDIRIRAADLQEKFNQHKAQLRKDDSLLKLLLQQEMKKKESLKAAEGKVMRLKEQLLASEKIVSANRVLLKKLQEQIQRIQHRVTVKQHQSVKLEKDLAQAQAATAPAAVKHSKSAALYSVVKVRRVDYSDTHYAELITQKKRLQQLESEYALKIQKLKEAQALRQAESQPTVPQTASPLYPLPQPSLHDLTQDKLTLSSEDVEAEDDEQQQLVPAAVTSSKRRRSFRESGSFTKPNLCHLEVPAALPVPIKHTKPSLCSTVDLPMLLLGLNVQDLRQRYQHCAGLSVLLQEEISALCGVLDNRNNLGEVVHVDFDPMAAHENRVEPKPEPFGAYHSPLLVFKSYRFSPYYRTKEKLSLRSVTCSNAIEPKKCFCRFDLTGTCNDDNCPRQHMRNCTLTESQFFQDILSYSLPLIGCPETSSTSDIRSATEKYMKKLFGANKDRMGTDQKAVLLVSKVNESLRHIPPFTTCKAQRRWRPEAQREKTDDQKNEDQTSVDVTVPVRHDVGVQKRWLSADICVTQDDKRYFDSETDNISNLETSVLESPNDVQLWIKLAFKYLNQKDISVSECLDAALNTLSRALEDNRKHAEVWCHYLTLFSRRGSREEVQEMCEMAVEHAPHYDIWWTYMSVESSFEGKDYVCGRLISHLLETQSHDIRSDVHSFQLLESVMFRVQLSVFTGRLHNALNILKSVLDSGSESSVTKHLTVPDRCLMWLSYIYMTEFKYLPPCLYDPSNSNPSRIVCADPFVIPWGTDKHQDIHTPTDDIISLFEDALSHCTDERLSSSEQIQACFPLHSNLINLLRLLDRHQEAVALCERLLAVCPLYCPLLDITSDLHVSTGHADKAADMWMRAYHESSRDARIFYQLSKCLHTQGRSSVMEKLFDKFMCSFCETVPDQLTSLDVLRHILGIVTRDLLRAPTLKDQLQDEIRDQLPYLHLIHCFWESVYGGVREAIDAFEKALGTITKLELIYTLWLDYLSFTSSKVLGLQPSVRELKMFTGLVHRCLETVPSRLTLPFSSSQYWNCFSFHNKVISFYLGCFPQSQHSLVLERLQHIMPTNTELAIRLLQQEWQDGNVEHFKLQSRMLCSSLPTCLAIWKIAIAVGREQRQKAEVQRLYQQALQKLPLSASLWKDCLLFEAAEGGKTDTLKKIIDKCQEVGVSLNEPLGLEPCQSQ
ncbi:zinc finger C3H1 domain-containing protein-like isoform X2 [Myxocyprinus asiaticus]|uniref:zinc finger C3H1 domain-containing protein-like isoform X2 n=1 Tax=Myxocyprinus asiaticus TaxID=70543 RepID=UPI00222268C4|nr:zinc finger C3H1 domain-containing protein-like isoform X2 [Myxocyprinus asiaticus]